jgi:glycosyltransferase involved in cell wall biosynthesis
MKIAIVCANYLPFMGGVEIHAQQVSRQLSQAYDVRLSAMNFGQCRLPTSLGVLHNNLLAPASSDSIDQDLPVTSLAPKAWDRIRMIPMALRAVPKVRRWFYHPIQKATHPFYASSVLPKLRAFVRGADVVHGLVHGDIGWAALRAARKESCPYVCTPFVHPHQWGDGPKDIDYYKDCDAVIGLVKSDRDYLESLGVAGDRLHTVGVSPNLPEKVDGDSFRKKHQIGDAPLVVYVGRMMRAKGAHAVVASMDEVWQHHPQTRFVFIGPAAGGEASIFDGLDTRASYMGRVSLSEKANAMAAADMVVMPSMSEILPTVYLEAWSLRKPVVAGMALGLPELVSGNRAGINVSQNSSEVAAAINLLINDPETACRMGQNGWDLVQREYTIESVSRSLESIYQSVSKHRNLSERSTACDC